MGLPRWLLERVRQGQLGTAGSCTLPCENHRQHHHCYLIPVASPCLQVVVFSRPRSAVAWLRQTLTDTWPPQLDAWATAGGQSPPRSSAPLRDERKQRRFAVHHATWRSFPMRSPRAALRSLMDVPASSGSPSNSHRRRASSVYVALILTILHARCM